MIPPVLVREALDTDMVSVQAIYAHEVLHGIATFEETPPTTEDMLGRRAAVLAKGFPYLVAEVDDRIVGYAYVNAFRPRPAYRYVVENSVYVDADMHRRGIGAALLAALIVRCEAIGLRQMVAVIGNSGNEGSIGLHARLGFRHVGVVEAVGFKFGRWIDTVYMQLPLGEGRDTLPAA